MELKVPAVELTLEQAAQKLVQECEPSDKRVWRVATESTETKLQYGQTYVKVSQDSEYALCKATEGLVPTKVRILSSLLVDVATLCKPTKLLTCESRSGLWKRSQLALSGFVCPVRDGDIEPLGKSKHEELSSEHVALGFTQIVSSWATDKIHYMWPEVVRAFIELHREPSSDAVNKNGLVTPFHVMVRELSHKKKNVA